MNAADLAKELKLDVRAVTGKLERSGYTVVNGSEIPARWIAVVCEEYKTPRKKRSKETNKAAKELLKRISPDDRGAALLVKSQGKGEEMSKLSYYIAISPLPILGLVASYGVYSFALHFVPFWMALLEACSFEVIYIALAALTGLSTDQRKRAKWVSVGALIVSVTYGSIAAALHLVDGAIMETLSLGWVISFAVLHGVPVPVLAYAVANLLLHRD